MMKNYLMIMLTLLTISLHAVNAQNYTASITVPNPNSFTNFLYSTDMTLAILYGPTSPNVTTYTGYNWQPLTSNYYT
jgi:hypothetical protein